MKAGCNSGARQQRKEGKGGYVVRRAISLFVVLAALTLAVSVPALTQEEGETQGAAQTQYAQEPAEAGCYWYWGYKWSEAGEWENWCWDPQKGGWWYATSEDGKKQSIQNSQPGVVISTQ
jgi:hypothetical protein